MPDFISIILFKGFESVTVALSVLSLCYVYNTDVSTHYIELRSYYIELSPYHIELSSYYIELSQ